MLFFQISSSVDFKLKSIQTNYLEIMKHTKLPVRFTGQHFTIDTALIKYTIELAELRHCDLVFDLGGGKGYITDQLLKKTSNIIVIENDKVLSRFLRRKFNLVKEIRVIENDILDYVFPDMIFKVVSNIPYAITSQVFKKLMYSNLRCFLGGCIITQLEPALKVTKKNSYNPYVVFYNTFYDISFVKHVYPTSFNPPPTVQSALLCIKRREYPIVPQDLSDAYIRFLFSLLRKPDMKTRTTLKQLFRKKQIRLLADKYFISLDKSITCLTVEQWANCFMEMRKIVPEEYHP